MKPSLGEDVTSILAITAGAAISAALTAALLLEEPTRQVEYRVDIVPRPPSPLHIYFAPMPPVRVVGPEGAHSHWFPEETLLHKSVREHGAPGHGVPGKRIPNGRER